jgi:hypothetical protein
VPSGHSLSFCVYGISGQGRGAPVRAPCGRARPTRPCGLRAATLPTLRGGGAAARPVPCGAGDMWRPRPGPCGPRPGQVGRQPLRGGTPPQCKAKPLRGGPMARPCIAPPPRRLRRRCSGAARPPLCGGCGAVRPSGPVGGASAPALASATPAARPRYGRPACALAARRSGRRPSRRFSPPSRGGGLRGTRLRPLSGALPKPCPSPLRGRNLDRRAHWRRQAPPSPRFARGGARGYAACGRDCRPVNRPARPRQAPRRRAEPATFGGLACRYPGRREGLRRVSRPVAGHPPISQPCRGCLLCLPLRVVCLALVVSGGLSAGPAVSLAGRCPALLGPSGHLPRPQVRPVRRWRLPLLAVSGPLVRPAGGWRSCGASRKKSPSG